MPQKYQPGQVWTYRTREGEEQSRLVILRTDQHPKLKNIVHVGGLAIRNPHDPEGVSRTITHMPFTEKAIDRSVIELEGTGAVPEFRDGYADWKESFERGEAGVFGGTVAEAIDTVERGLSGPG